MTLGESHQSFGAKIPTWVKTLAAPLLLVSVGLHGMLLVIPLPSHPTPPEEEPAAEEEFVDLLSLGTLPEPTPESALPETPPLAATSPAPASPAAPSGLVIPDPAAPAAPLPPTTTLADTPLPADPAATPPSAAAPAGAPIQSEEVAAIFTNLTRGSGESDFDSTATSFPYAAYNTRGGIGEWSPSERTCFFTQISADTYTSRPNVVSLRYLTRNVQFIAEKDIPRTFPSPQFQVTSEPSGYCNRSLFQVVKDGQPYLFISLVGVGVGTPGQQASGLVIIWASDPRSG